ncbi:hypothetical protein [Pectobacterium versatile]|uniref:hypothetical protein n=1 Tax=Pectobacterium versatile TaxID=2488639 RepID=UPI001B36668C|nr:hypothetical protein [Pectobacterium versatile]MBQ4775614.1 hypothetical protein [Pectobacterium versatile]
MSRNISDEDYRAQKRDLYALLGEFAAEFEIICLHMRNGITMLASQSGLKDQNIMQAALAEYTAHPLLKVFRSMFMDSKFINKDIEKNLTEINKRMTALIETRNSYIHGTFFVGYGNGTETEFKSANGHKLKNTSKGVRIERHSIDETTFRPHIQECHDLADLVLCTWTKALLSDF